MPEPRDPREPAATDPLALASSGARELALTDDLTGAQNRRSLRRLFEREWQGLLDRHERITLLVLDLDLFKEVNDRYGHAAGDVVLRAVAARLSESFREEDRLIRYGGDEFVVVLPGAGPAEARSLAERARQALAGDRWRDPLTGGPVDVPVSFSIGVASAPADGASGDTVLAAADRRLYEEKKSRHHEPRPRRVRLARWALLLAAAAASALALPFFVARRGETPPPTPSTAVFEARERARDEASRREAELAALRAELAEMRARSGPALSAEERRRYEARIRDLELAAAASNRAARTPPAPTERPATEPRELGASAGGDSADAMAAPGPAATAAPEPGRPPAMPIVVAPLLIGYEPPAYPQAARVRGVEAEIEIAVRVDREGRVVEAALVGASPGFGLDEAALVAARSARYRAGTRDGVAAEMETTLRIVFRMGESGRR